MVNWLTVIDIASTDTSPLKSTIQLWLKVRILLPESWINVSLLQKKREELKDSIRDLWASKLGGCSCMEPNIGAKPWAEDSSTNAAAILITCWNSCILCARTVSSAPVCVCVCEAEGQSHYNKPGWNTVLVCADRMLNLKEKWFSPCCDSTAVFLCRLAGFIFLPFVTAWLNLSHRERDDDGSHCSVMAALHFYSFLISLEKTNTVEALMLNVTSPFYY